MKISVKITREENATYFNKKIDDTVQVEFEEYVAAVVASEIGNASIEACKAQAIAARSFAVSRSVFKDKAISDSSSVAQAYRAPLYNREKYPKLCFGLVKFNDYEKDSFVCDDIKQMSADDLHDITY